LTDNGLGGVESELVFLQEQGGEYGFPMPLTHLHPSALRATSLGNNTISANRGGGSSNTITTAKNSSSSTSIRTAESRLKDNNCDHCGTKQAPAFRRDLSKTRTLCNKCALYEKQHKAARPLDLKPLLKRPIHEDGGNKRCLNCCATETPLWRRDAHGNTLCNACGLYSKSGRGMRPVTTATNVIKRRNRNKDNKDKKQPKRKRACSDLSLENTEPALGSFLQPTNGYLQTVPLQTISLQMAPF